MTFRKLETSCVLGLFGLLTLCATLAVSSGCGAPSIPRNLLNISVHPANSFVLLGATVTFAATATFDRAPLTQDNFPAQWTSSDTSLATIDANGVATCVQLGGPITITASASNKGVAVTASATLNCSSQVSDVEFAPDPLRFACVYVFLLGCDCTPQKTTNLTNNGTTTLRINSITVPGPDYHLISTTCGPQLAAGESCSVAVGWSRVAREGAVLVDDNAVGSPHSATLSGALACTP